MMTQQDVSKLCLMVLFWVVGAGAAACTLLESSDELVGPVIDGASAETTPDIEMCIAPAQLTEEGCVCETPARVDVSGQCQCVAPAVVDPVTGFCECPEALVRASDGVCACPPPLGGRSTDGRVSMRATLDV